MNQIIYGDILTELPKLSANLIDIIITSPPYWSLRCNDGDKRQLGNETTIEKYISNLVNVFSQCKRILKPDGLLFLNLGDTYFGYWGNKNCGTALPPSYRSKYNENERPKFKPCGWKQDKQKALLPHRVAIALQDDGWIVRQDIVWHKPNYRRERVKNRLNCSNEYWFMCCLDGRTKRFNKGLLKSDLMVYRTSRTPEHNSTFPEHMIFDILSCCEGNLVFDPFMGSGTTALAALKTGKNYLGVELYQKYEEIFMARLNEK